MSQVVTLIISVLAVLISTTTAWLTLFRRGTVKMTQPTVVFFGPDGASHELESPSQKVFFRTLLYSTSKRGQIIESMFVRLNRGETSQTFNIWVYGDDRLLRGSGLFVGETGVASNHHFLLPSDGTVYKFLAGGYTLNIFAKLVDGQHIIKLFEVKLQLSDQMSLKLDQRSDSGVYFDWGSDSHSYTEHVRTQSKVDLSRLLLGATAPQQKRTRKKSDRNSKATSATMIDKNGAE